MALLKKVYKQKRKNRLDDYEEEKEVILFFFPKHRIVKHNNFLDFVVFKKERMFCATKIKK
mgnify:CR=1 FL=1